MKVTSRTVPINKIDRAECNSDEFGFIKIIYLEKSYEILGACIMSPCAGEMISEIAGETSISTIRNDFMPLIVTNIMLSCFCWKSL